MSEALMTSIVLKSNVTLVDIVSTRMLGQYGFLAKVFGVSGGPSWLLCFGWLVLGCSQQRWLLARHAVLRLVGWRQRLVAGSPICFGTELLSEERGWAWYHW